jgi:iron complex transport system substrate-binding protein
MKRIFFALLTIVLILSACTPASAPAPAAASDLAITLNDGLGRQVTLASPAQKIVSLAPSNTEILYAIGAGSAIIGRDDLSDYPQEVVNLPTVGGSMGKYNFEEITKLQPDLVLASDLNTPEQIKSLEDLKITVYVLPNPTQLQGMYQNLETVGTLTGHSAEAARLSADLMAREKAVTNALASVTGRPKVFYELDATDPAKPYTAGANTFIDVLIFEAGGANIGASLQGDYPQISQEELLTQDPAIILLGDAAYGITPDQVAARPGWDVIKAVKSKQVFAIDDNLISRPGPRLVDGLETLAKLIHPEAFK